MGARVYETAGVESTRAGKIRVLIGGASTGQGIETVMAQIAADELGVSPEQIEVVYGDTNLIPDGVGSWSSRSTVIGGSAVRAAARATAEKARRRRRTPRGGAESDLVVADGAVHVVGIARSRVTLGEFAARMRHGTGRGSGRAGRARGARGLRRRAHELPVRREPRPGRDRPRRRAASRCGAASSRGVRKAINPMLVEGQAVGGVAQGLGGALLEEFVYDEDGQPRATTFMDYLPPDGAEVPAVDVCCSRTRRRRRIRSAPKAWARAGSSAWARRSQARSPTRPASPTA